jgi:transcriptional regulator with XRE-family HTH domain
MAGHSRWEDIRRTTGERLEDQRQWAHVVLEGASLAELRQLVGLSQEALGKAIGVSQVEVGRSEKRDDPHLSTLRRYLRALGGELEVYARFGEGRLVPLRVGEEPSQADGADTEPRPGYRRVEAGGFQAVVPIEQAQYFELLPYARRVEYVKDLVSARPKKR